MKISMFHLMPHRDLPADFEQRYHSVWVDPPWWELADGEPGRPVLQLDLGRTDPCRQGPVWTASASTNTTRTPTGSCPVQT